MNNEQFARLVDNFEACGYGVRSYTGRGMNGSSCLAVTCDNPIECVMDVIREACSNLDLAEDVADVIDHLGAARADSMGLQQIVYFPDVEWPDGAEETDSG